MLKPNWWCFGSYLNDESFYDTNNVNPLLKEENLTGFQSNDSCLECKWQSILLLQIMFTMKHWRVDLVSLSIKSINLWNVCMSTIGFTDFPIETNVNIFRWIIYSLNISNICLLTYKDNRSVCCYMEKQFLYHL